MATPGDVIQIHSYKHSGAIHRVWDKALFLEETPDFVVLANEKTRVIESNGKSWYTKEPSVCFFFKHRWFNVIAMIKPDGVHYYCNIGSPYTIDAEALKYIDYDLDIKIFPDRDFKVLDKFEYQRNAAKMAYSDELRRIIKYEMAALKQAIKQQAFPFQDALIQPYWAQYQSMQTSTLFKATNL
jgi:protein associated with RNAse G/E